jgi:hypothetical protein
MGNKMRTAPLSNAEQDLLNAVAFAVTREKFKGFDTSRVLGWSWTTSNKRLAAALDALLPDGRYKSGYHKGDFKRLPVRRLFYDLASRGCFTVGDRGWWFLKEE